MKLAFVGPDQEEDLNRQIVEGECLSLGSIKPGASVRVVKIDEGKVFRQRLLNLGIVPGVEMKTVRGGGGNPMVLEIQGSKIVLGAGMASRVYVNSIK